MGRILDQGACRHQPRSSLDGKLPVEEERCVTPPNCLRLAWRSQKDGDWRVNLNLRKHWGRLDFSGTTLSFWCYSEAGLSPDASPLIRLADASGEATPSIRFIGTLDRPRDPGFDPLRVRKPSIP